VHNRNTESSRSAKRKGGARRVGRKEPEHGGSDHAVSETREGFSLSWNRISLTIGPDAGNDEVKNGKNNIGRLVSRFWGQVL